MSRFLFAFAALLLACAALATPVPEPFGSSWGDSVNPDRDCKIRRSNYALTIEMPGGDHDYDSFRERENAPRILREIEGNFEMQVRVRIDCRPSAQSTVKGQPSFVAAGFLLIPPEDYSPYKNAVNYIRFEYGLSREGIGADGYVAHKTMERQQLELIDIWGRVDGCAWQKYLIRKEGRQMREFLDRIGPKWPPLEKADQVYLRSEHREGWFSFFISPDGEKWTKVAKIGGPPAKLKLGLAAYSTSTESSKVRFDRLKLIRLRKK